MSEKRGFLQHSLLLKLGGALALIACFAILGMASSGIIAESVQGSGEAINLAGSLRMQTYRMSSLALSARQSADGNAAVQLGDAIDTFESTLTDPRITELMPRQAETELSRSYATVQQAWQKMKPRFRAEVGGSASVMANQVPLIAEVNGFVDKIDHLVKQIERDTEAKILVLRMVLGAALLMTLLVGSLTLYLARNDLILPLRDLLSFAANVGRGNLAVRTEHTGSDELGRLGQAFNHMAEDLSRMYQNLEARVEEKTAELTIANRSLELLYHSIARLYNGPVAASTYAILLNDLENVLGVGHGLACLVEAGETRARVIASTLHPDAGDPSQCGLTSCAECLAHRTLAVHALPDGRRMLTLPLKDTEHHYGVLQLEMPPGKELAQWQTQLLEALSRHIGIAIGTARRTEQSRRLSLLEERAALARELHDSLAQSLAYMKIQVSRLKPLLPASQPGAGSEANEVLAELREGLNSAYRQLRELLTTFRLRIEGEGLGAALQDTVNEFTARGGIPITLDVHLAGCTLTPNEEIHALQIVREALSNVLNHARAQQAKIRVLCNSDGSVSAIVTDDGIGVRQAAGAHHYGMTIMEERARNLGGQLSVENLPAAGTRVTLHFMPTSRRAPLPLPTEQLPPSL
ncbi:type IV pili methyl-accepting chemotaxis transducer N-terminal domain-containing protein [Thiobacillus sp.]|uniref:type IV pili methyl-accepting chemotaxis transducer N-terminal domain-containing protein n=1 Tax=Thiobacillus sp. TaxID=924 RepID=UPI0017D12EFA|nr:type IV pili methyl-accepting chemotaxis transducer N-terminal domain-containing protein [Thiobacillus sp.]MBC2732325.1 HAMP domain-containing protein [Thiobacillus sp.]MBC2741063.1 type IV pili methyl-accepting chemotaxis transducer N-terminal domain-containing protein [Thiobacillus sp.]MBC2759752.1 type IV pili methyl-accepting chemotaxis transducer N-terminal domain-containing protein [Thiobacillus sp.]